MNKLITCLISFIALLSVNVHAKCGYKADGYHYDTKIEQLAETEKYLNKAAPENFQFGLHAVEINESSIYIVYGSKTTLNEYEANKEKVSQLIVYEPQKNKGGTLLLTPLFILNPGLYSDKMFGCSEEQSSTTRLNTDTEKPTGKSEVVYDFLPLSQHVTLKIESNGKSMILSRIIMNKGMVESIDLRESFAIPQVAEFIKANQKAGIVDITVSCLKECSDYDDKNNQELSFKKSISFKSDLGELFKSYSNYLGYQREIANAQKKAQIEAEARRIAAKQRAEEDRIKAQEEKQKAIDRANQAKLDAATRAQAAEQKSLDQFKEKCANLGFKTGTDAFGKCVLQLTK
jgi:hypothetical protein